MTHGIDDEGATNLTMHRAARSVWDKPGWDGTPSQQTATRLLIGLGGGALALQGMRQKSWMGTALATIGGSLAWWALTGEAEFADARRWFDRTMAWAWPDADDLVHEASADSFPASDAPSWTPTVGTGIRHTPNHGTR